jgi:hypothetical protein
MNLKTFWKSKPVIDIYLKSGAVITLTGVKRFAVQSSKIEGTITKLEWEFLPGHQHLLDIQLSEIAAIIERKP